MTKIITYKYKINQNFLEDSFESNFDNACWKLKEVYNYQLSFLEHYYKYHVAYNNTRNKVFSGRLALDSKFNKKKLEKSLNLELKEIPAQSLQYQQQNLMDIFLEGLERRRKKIHNLSYKREGKKWVKRDSEERKELFSKFKECHKHSVKKHGMIKKRSDISQITFKLNKENKEFFRDSNKSISQIEWIKVPNFGVFKIKNKHSFGDNDLNTVTPTYVTLKRNPRKPNDFMILITFKVEKTLKKLKNNVRKVRGFDLNMKDNNLLTSSKNEVVKIPPKIVKKLEVITNKIEKTQSKRDNSNVKSNEFESFNKKFIKLNIKRTNVLNDYYCKLSKELFNNHKLLIFEDLSPSDMKRKGNRKNNKMLSHIKFGEFLKRLNNFNDLSDVDRIIFVNPAYTSKTCFDCKSINKSLKSEKKWTCPSCGIKIERDLNAAKNIEFLGLGKTK